MKRGFICKNDPAPKTFIYNDYQPNYTPIKSYVLEGCKHRLWFVSLIYKLYLASAAVAQ